MTDDIAMMYQEMILEHYKNPQNAGTLDQPSVKHREYNPLCGDDLEMFLTIKDGKVEDIKFKGKGCAISQASASLLTEKVKGMSIKDIQELKKEDVLELLGIELSAVRLKCAMLALDTIKNAIHIHGQYVEEGKNG